MSNGEWLIWFNELKRINQCELDITEKFIQIFGQGIAEELQNHALWHKYDWDESSSESKLADFCSYAEIVAQQIQFNINFKLAA